jgi:hypothetical protein
MGRLRRILLLLAMVSMAGGTFAAAEPIIITTGSITLPQDAFDPEQPITLSGSDGVRPFTFIGDIDGGDSNLAAYACRPCSEGTAELSIDILAPGTIGGDVIYGSESYVTASGLGPTEEHGALSLSVLGRVSLPASAPAPGEVVTITAPFTMTGFILPPESSGGRSNQLTGSGMAMVRLSGDPVDGLPLWSFHSAEYRFLTSASPNPVPEPASMLLLGSGLAALVLRRGRARRASWKS